MIDLHAHTTASDGTLTPQDLVDRAAAKGLCVLAVTDPDTVDGIPAALERGEEHRVEVIPGIELGAKWNGDGQMPNLLVQQASGRKLLDSKERQLVRTKPTKGQEVAVSV